MEEKVLTQEEIDKAANEIREMDHHTMCYNWRMSPTGTNIYFRKDLIASSGTSLGDIYTDRLFKHFGGFTPEISKSIGWG